MSFVKSLISAAAAATAIAKKMKFGVLTDIHLNPNYKSNITGEENQFCIGNVLAEELAYFGRSHCDSP